MPKENKMIRALSLDFDGSFGGGKRDFRPRGNETFHDYLAIKNQKLLNEINAETKNGTEVIVMVGSNRQSVESENSATPLRNKWCAPVLNAVITSIKEPTIRFDGFLLGDVYRKDQTQESEFDRIQKFASDRTKTIEKNDPVPVDKTKLSILYAQMHKIASENPEATIVFDFYDDKTEILDSLNTFLTKNPDLIPKNVTLQLHRYVSFDDKTNEKLEEHCEDTTYETKKIQGEGPIDAFYIENTKRLTDIGYEGYQPAADKHPDLINALNLAPEKLSLFKKEKKGLWKGENYDLFKKDLLFYCQEEKKGSNLLLVEMDFSRGLWPSDLSDKEIKINDENPYGYKINGHQILLNENMTENERYEAVLIKIWAGLLNIEVNAKNTEELKKIYLSAKKGVEEHHKRKQKTTPFQIKGPIAYKKLQKIGLMHRQDVPSPLTNFFVRKQVSLDGNKIAGGRKDFIDIKRNGETVAITTLLDGSVKYSVTANIVLQAEDSSIMPGIPLGPISYAIIAKADGSFEIEHDAFHIKSKALCDYLSGNQSDLENPTRQCLFLKECIEEAKEHYPQWEKSDLHDNLLIKHTKAHRQEITPLKEWVKEAERRKLAFKEATYDKRQETFDHYYNEVNVHPVPKD